MWNKPFLIVLAGLIIFYISIKKIVIKKNNFFLMSHEFKIFKPNGTRAFFSIIWLCIYENVTMPLKEVL